MEITEEMVRRQMRANSYEYGVELEEKDARELAELQLKDLIRKGCICPGTDDCRGCAFFAEGKCPLNDWEKRNPEFASDKLAKKIKALENSARDKEKEAHKAKVLAEFQKWKSGYDTRISSGKKTLLNQAKELADKVNSIDPNADDAAILKSFFEVAGVIERLYCCDIAVLGRKSAYFAY